MAARKTSSKKVAKKKTTKKRVSRKKTVKKPRGAANKGVECHEMQFKAGEEFARADLLFTGVDHSNLSYEVRVFLNNRRANANTARTLDNGYAGRFIIFGHAGCFGGAGHCEIPNAPKSKFDLRPPHPLTPVEKIVTITDTLNHVLRKSNSKMTCVMLVPVSHHPKKSESGPTDKLFKYEKMELRTYR